jgi:D-serine deaminase-like pyridoxal phosphate-dependent protein
LRKEGIEINEISIGSTPGAEYSSTIDGVTELRAGNYVFYDMIQVGLGVVGIEDCSLSVLASVVSTPAEGRAVIDAGSKSLGLDRGAHSVIQTKGYGYIYGKNAEIVRLSEEHGIISHCGGTFQIGEKIRIIPNHACAVSNLYDYAHLVDGVNYIGKVAIEARGKSQ